MKRIREIGMTLIEMLIVICIVAIMLGMATYSYQNIIKYSRIEGETRDLQGDVQFARAAASRQGIDVTICSSTNPNSASPNCGQTSQWQTGWIIFTDVSDTQNFTSGDTLLRVHAALNSTDTITGKQGTIGSFTAGNLNYITFNRLGSTNQNGELETEDVNDTLILKHCVVVSATGSTTFYSQQVNPGTCP